MSMGQSRLLWSGLLPFTFLAALVKSKTAFTAENAEGR